MRQSIFSKFSPLVLNSDVLGIVDNNHAASMNKPTSFEILHKSRIKQRLNDGIVSVNNEGLILFRVPLVKENGG